MAAAGDGLEAEGGSGVEHNPVEILTLLMALVIITLGPRRASASLKRATNVVGFEAIVDARRRLWADKKEQARFVAFVAA
jgi:hypothetical protein